MSKIFNAARIFAAGIFLCGLILISGRASAASGMDIFIETLGKTAASDDRVFNQDIYFVVPSAVSELDIIGCIENGKLRMTGNFGFWTTDDNGVPTDFEVPFYIVQTNDNVTIYFQQDKKWKKMTSPIPLDEITAAFANNTYADFERQVNRVKEVVVLRETETQRTLLVKFDGNKLADELLAGMKADAQKDPMNSKIFSYVDSGIRNADVWYTWTVNKNTWQTVAVSANLSGLVQSIAQTVLNDTEQPLPAVFADMLEPFAYYSELRVYTTYLSDEAKSRLVLPKEVLKAKEVKSPREDSKKK